MRNEFPLAACPSPLSHSLIQCGRPWLNLQVIKWVRWPRNFHYQVDTTSPNSHTPTIAWQEKLHPEKMWSTCGAVCHMDFCPFIYSNNLLLLLLRFGMAHSFAESITVEEFKWENPSKRTKTLKKKPKQNRKPRMWRLILIVVWKASKALKC